jgi:hypothetical protein
VIRRRARVSASRVTPLLALVLLASPAACANPAAATVPPTQTAVPTASIPPTPTTLPTPAVEPTASVWSSIPIDHALLDHLPPEINGIVRSTSDEGVIAGANDPDVARVARSIAGGLYVDPLTGDFAYAALLRLRDGAMTEEWFAGWRDEYDASACEQAGGVTRAGERTIEGRQVHTGECAGGARTWHLLLGNSGILLSVTDVGDAGLGERLIEDLPE